MADDPFIFYRTYWHREGWCVGEANENIGEIRYVSGPHPQEIAESIVADKNGD